MYVPVLLWALVRAPWWRLRTPEGQHLVFGAWALTSVLWNIRAGIAPGLSFHLLGASLLTLVFGWEFAFLILSATLVLITSVGHAGWTAFSLNGLLMAAVPVLVAYRIFLVADKYLPNFFIYVLVCGFLGGGVAMAATLGIATGLVLWPSGAYPLEHLLKNYLAYAPLLMLPEAFINGALAALLVGYKPHWVRTFRDERYLNGK